MEKKKKTNQCPFFLPFFPLFQLNPLYYTYIHQYCMSESVMFREIAIFWEKRGRKTVGSFHVFIPERSDLITLFFLYFIFVFFSKYSIKIFFLWKLKSFGFTMFILHIICLRVTFNITSVTDIFNMFFL